MNIYTVCVDPERGRYLAISTEDPKMFAVSEGSFSAVGVLVTNNPGIQIDQVIDIDTVLG